MKISKIASLHQALMTGLFLTFMFGFYLYSYAIGSWLIQDGRINPATGEVYSIVQIVQVAQATMTSMMVFGSIIPVVPAIVKALISGKLVFDVIERKPLIHSPQSGKSALASKVSLQDGIRFENVSFRYPTAPEGSRDVFQNVSFKIEANTSTAIVGPSGSGKSTIV